MKYVLSYWESGKRHYQNLNSEEFNKAEIEAIGIMEDEHVDAYHRNEWEVQEL